MAFKFSTGIRMQQCFHQSLRDILTDTEIRIYSGDIPTSPDSAIGQSNTLLVTIRDSDGGGLIFEPAGSEPTLIKNLSQLWEGDVISSGTATFFRMCKSSDTDNNSSTALRVQGSVGGPDADMVISNPALIAGANQRIEYFAISMLEQG